VFVEPDLVIGSAQYKQDSDWLVKFLGSVGRRDCVIYPHIVFGSGSAQNKHDSDWLVICQGS
jgi:hypothetical protein